jgi:hypothetical protein
VPLNPSFTDAQWSDEGTGPWGLFGISFPIQNQLGISTIWSKLSDDGTTLIYYMVVLNFSNSTIEYAFLEANL